MQVSKWGDSLAIRLSPTSSSSATKTIAVAKIFIDGNVILYLLSKDAKKADATEAVLRAGGAITVQVLNEIANVALKKL